MPGTVLVPDTVQRTKISLSPWKLCSTSVLTKAKSMYTVRYQHRDREYWEEGVRFFFIWSGQERHLRKVNSGLTAELSEALSYAAVWRKVLRERQVQRFWVGVLFLVCLANNKDAIMSMCGWREGDWEKSWWCCRWKVKRKKEKDRVIAGAKSFQHFKKCYSECVGSQ